MSGTETLALTFDCRGSRLVGLLHRPAQPRALGVVVVAGAPQYRVGSHRHFVLLARRLAAEGYAVLRFDYRGMGDSDGEFLGFEGVDEDIRAAVDTLIDRVPEVEAVALWGLCDGASAIAFYAAGDDRVRGSVLVNPWVRTDRTLAREQIGGHYRRRLSDREFWRRLVTGRVALGRAAGGLVRTLIGAIVGVKPSQPAETLPQRVARGIRRFQRPVLVILSGQDLTAGEFERAVLKDREMAAWASRPEVRIERLEAANHTYSRETWRRQIHDWTMAWLAGL